MFIINGLEARSTRIRHGKMFGTQPLNQVAKSRTGAASDSLS